MTSSARNVLVSVPFFDPQAKSFLEENGCSVTVTAKPDNGMGIEESIERLSGMRGWIVGHAWVTREVLQASPSLEVIARRGVGYERVDTDAAAELGRVVTIAAGGNAPSVADHTVGFMLAAGRRFNESQTRMLAGDWRILVGTELYGKTVGLIGFGRIAQLVAKRLAGFDVTILSFTTQPDTSQAAKLGVRLVDLPTLLRESDYISLHLPGGPDTQGMIDEAAFAAMKPECILLNTSRGGLIDERALLEALRNKRIRGAALDLFQGEIDPDYKEIADQLLALPNFVATPHAAGSTEEALSRSNLIAARTIVDVFDRRSPSRECIVADGR